jgi:hypothetical protein
LVDHIKEEPGDQIAHSYLAHFLGKRRSASHLQKHYDALLAPRATIGPPAIADQPAGIAARQLRNVANEPANLDRALQ